MPEEIICMTEEQWREKEIETARAEARARQLRWKEKHAADRERRLYFCRQRFIGLLLTVLSIVLCAVTGNIAALPFAAIGGCIMVTKKMILVDGYYWTHGGPEQWDD